jgi:hypothetical protein
MWTRRIPADLPVPRFIHLGVRALQFSLKKKIIEYL